jgi:hypothetical protein
MKNVVLVLAALALMSCSTYDAVRFLADASRPSQPAEPAPAPAEAHAASQTPPSAPAPAEVKQAPVAEQKAPAGLDAASKAEWIKYSQPASSGKTFGAGADLSASSTMTLKAGEWAVYRNSDKGQVKGVIKMALVGKEGDAWIYEFVSYTDKEVVVIQEAVKGLDEMVQTGNADKGQILWIKMKDKSGKIQTLDGAMLGMAGNSYKSMITANTARAASTITDGGIVNVPAGTFTSTWKAETQVSQGRGSENGTAWISTQVPLWRLIKAQGKSGQVLELVDFGSSGYQSSMK